MRRTTAGVSNWHSGWRGLFLANVRRLSTIPCEALGNSQSNSIAAFGEVGCRAVLAARADPRTDGLLLDALPLSLEPVDIETPPITMDASINSALAMSMTALTRIWAESAGERDDVAHPGLSVEVLDDPYSGRSLASWSHLAETAEMTVMRRDAR